MKSSFGQEASTFDPLMQCQLQNGTTFCTINKKQIKKIDEDLNVKKININLLQKKMAN